MSKRLVTNVETGVVFNHPTYGVCQVGEFIQTGSGKLASDIWAVRVMGTGEFLTLTDWAIRECEEVAD